MLSPSLLNLCTEQIFREVDDLNGVKINGIKINNLRPADDTALCAFAQMIYKCCEMHGRKLEGHTAWK